jgi:DNA-binding MarR family transcriptional regulator
VTDQPPRYSLQLREIAGLARRYHELLAGSLDLNATSLDAMDWLIRDGSLTPTEISARLGISPGATTSVLRRLHDTGHAHRIEHDADRRSVRIVPEPASVDAARSLLDPLIRAMGDRVSRYSDADLALVSAFLDDVAAAYREGIASLSGSVDPDPDPQPGT